MTKLVIGCGYLGYRVATRWLAAGDQVWAVTRSAPRAADWEAIGIHPIVADVTQTEPWPALPTPISTVLYAVGRTLGTDMRSVYVGGLGRVLDALPPNLERLIYISSTGVYGQQDGSFVDEQSPCEPAREGGRIVLEAENVLRAHPLGDRATVLRLAGIYGPGRVPYLDAIRDGESLAVPAEGYLNLIHVEDAAEVVLLAERYSQPPRTYLVSDGHPVTRRCYYEELARRLNAPRPTFVEATAGDSRSERAGSSKRLDIRKLLTELPVKLRYPNFRHGLRQILAERVVG